MNEKQRDDVYAVEGGVVLYALKTPSDYGWRIYIRHNDGTTAMYGHLSAFHIKNGQSVEEGALIATIGETGNCPSGKHLHMNYFTKTAPALTGEWAVDPTYWIMLHAYPTNTKVTGGYHQTYEDVLGKQYKHEGIDFGYTALINGWVTGIDAIYQDYKLKRNYPHLYKE